MVRLEVKFVDFGIEAGPSVGYNEIIEPVNLCLLSGAVKKESIEGIGLSLFQRKSKETFSQFENRIINDVINALKNDVDTKVVAAFTCVTANYEGIQNAAEKIKKELNKELNEDIKSRCWLVIGGSHPTGVLSSIHSGESHRFKLDDNNKNTVTKEIFTIFDFLMSGESENALVELLKKIVAGENKERIKKEIKQNGIKGIAFLEKKGEDEIYYNGANENRGLFNYDSELVSDEDREYYLADQIGPSPYIENNEKIGTLLTAKGCPHNCRFCANKQMWNCRIKRMRPSDVMKEIKNLYKMDIKYFWFHDETITSPAKELEDLLNLFSSFKQSHQDFFWAGMGRIDDFYDNNNNSVIEERIRAFKEAGCWLLSLGVEFSDEDRIKNIKKISGGLESVKKVFAGLFEGGILPVAFFILGMPKEKNDTMLPENLELWQETLLLAKELKAIRYRFCFFYPFLGTEIRKRIDESKGINLWITDELPSDFKIATTEYPVIKVKGISEERFLSQEEMIAWRDRIYREVYGSREYFQRILKFAGSGKNEEKAMEIWYKRNHNVLGNNWDLLTADILRARGGNTANEKLKSFFKNKMITYYRTLSSDLRGGFSGITEDMHEKEFIEGLKKHIDYILECAFEESKKDESGGASHQGFGNVNYIILESIFGRRDESYLSEGWKKSLDNEFIFFLRWRYGNRNKV